MNKIYKYEIPLEDQFEIEVPEDYEILTLQMQNNKPCIWMAVDPKRKLTKLTFKTYGTGDDIESEKVIRYIGTYQKDFMVWHVFQKK